MLCAPCLQLYADARAMIASSLGEVTSPAAAAAVQRSIARLALPQAVHRPWHRLRSATQ
jgi:hypothetical protein